MNRALAGTYTKSFDVKAWAPPDGGGSGFTLWDVEANEPITWKEWSAVTQGQLWSVKVVGAGKYHADELQLDAFEPGVEVSLLREPANPYDKNAVAVYDAGRQHLVGYVPREDAVAVGRAISSGARAFVVWEAGDGTRRTGLRISLVSGKLKTPYAEIMADLRVARK